jgi:class 3 adenylate cyclase/predicted ATPase
MRAAQFSRRFAAPTADSPELTAFGTYSERLLPAEVANMDIADWLRTLGLQQYVALFQQNDIDAEVLPALGADDLRELGIASLGHRKKLLAAIAGLADRPSVAATAESLHDELATGSAATSAERRQLTVMFCDLVGSTALAAQLDPEDLREVIGAYHRRVAKVVGRYDGFVAKYMGDGVLIYFGYPQAHEDDAERAVRAGLKLVGTMDRILSRTEAPLQARVGIATGLVVVGDLIGSGEAQERGIVGETPNLAARLQGVAEPNTVVIAEGTRKLLGDLFELQDLGPQDLKGITGPVRAWSPLRAGSAEGRFEAMHAAGVTELVGREEELELLLRRWSRAKTGEGQVVLLSGEPGIGKSRLTAALLERLAAEPHTRLRYFCSPQHTDSAFFPIIAQLERAACLTHDDTAPRKLDKLDALLAQSSTAANDAALFAEMLSLPNDGRYPALDLAPEQRRQKTLEALVSQTEALARQNPVLIIFEDAHWTDPTSLEVFGGVVDRIGTLRALLVVTFRPEFEAPWTGQPHVAAVTINRLTQRDVVAMIDRVVGNNLIAATMREDIIERTDGIPLFVEEMTKAVLEAEREGEARRTAAAVPSPALAVPASLHASLMARLDRLGAAKEVAQIGAAIGREFSHALLAPVLGKPEPELGSALDRLINAGLLFRRGVAPHATYLFKHALVQDAAYGTLLREPRRALHARIVEVIESQFMAIAGSKPELLARHCTEAGLVDKAARLWGRAGQQSLTRSALVEAAAQFTRALAQIAALPLTAAVRRDEIKLQIGLGNALIDVKGHAAPETKSAFRRARDLIKQAEELGESPDDPLLQFSMLLGLWRAAYVAFDGDLMGELATEFLALAEKQGAKVPLAIAHSRMGMTLGFTGNIGEGRERLDRALTIYDPVEHRPLATRFSSDPGVNALSFRAWTLWLLGYPEAAQADIAHAVNEAREIGLAATLMLALGITNYTHILSGNYLAASAFADELVALASEKSALLRKAEAIFQQGCALAMSGRANEALQTITSGVRAWRSTGATCWTPLHMSFLANVHARLGQFDDARRCIGEAMAASEASKESWYDADIHRLAGDIVLLSGEPDTAKAEMYFEHALAIARKQQAKSFELRAATSMARLWRDQGKRDEARSLLSPVYGWFTEGFDTTDLRQAKALLDELT